MKKIIAFSLVVLFLTACSTSNNVASNKLFQKRKYNKGWHVNSSKKIDKTTSSQTEEVVYAEELIKSDAEESTKNNNILLAENKESHVEKLDNFKTEDLKQSKTTNQSVGDNVAKASGLTDNTALNSEIIIEENHQNINESKSKLITNSSNEAPNSGSDVGIVLLVILAILLPPLAVFLARGIGTEFWISLILTLFLWLPGVIYALLIVLDVI